MVQELNLTLNAMRQNIIGAVDNTITGISAKLNEAQNMASQAQYKVSHVPTQQREMASKQRQHRIKEELYLYLLNKREEQPLNTMHACSTPPEVTTAPSRQKHRRK